MKWFTLSAAMLVCSLTGSAQAGLFDCLCHKGEAAAEPTCGCPTVCEPSCCAPVAQNCHVSPTCCAPGAHNCHVAPTCCAPAAKCCNVEPSCCAPAPTCCNVNVCAPSCAAPAAEESKGHHCPLFGG